jgi:hypothetical protein
MAHAPGTRSDGGLGRVDRAVLDALLPAAPEIGLPGILETDFGAFLDDFRRVAPRAMRLAFEVALVAAGWWSPLMIHRLPPLSRLDAAGRDHALQAMAHSRLALPRQLLRVLKTIVGLHYGAVDEVRLAIGYRQ